MVKHMSRFIKNDRGIMGLTLSQIGLLIAVGILLAAIVSLVFLNDWNRNAELKNIATSFSSMVENMDTRFFEDTIGFSFSEGNHCNVSMSTEYIILRSKGNLNGDLPVKERFLVRPWPQLKNSSWFGRIGLHNYLKGYLHNDDTHDWVNESGNISDPITTDDISFVKNYLFLLQENVNKSLALNPLYIFTNKIVYIDKAIIYYDNNDDGIWNDGDEKQEFVFVYQY
jgi:hypothetical protein